MNTKDLNYFYFRKFNEDITSSIDNNDIKEFLRYLISFQKGDFSLKKEFIIFFTNTKDWDVFVLGMRLFMSICNHDDFNLLIDFFKNCDENELRVFLAFVQESLSLQSIPYLLALYEDWEETEIGTDISRCICEMLNIDYHEDEKYDIQTLGDCFKNFASQNDMTLYYYEGHKFFIGDLTKKTIDISFYCLKNNRKYFIDQISSIISNSVGLECPVYCGTEINDIIINNLFEYVKNISNFRLNIGKKYFYNHLI